MRALISRLLAAFAILAGLSLGARAAQESINITPDLVSNLAKGYGSAVLQKDSKGNPVIFGQIKGEPYAIVFIDCSRDSCSMIQFLASVDSAGIALDRVNEWNNQNRFGKASLSKDKIFISQPVVSLYGLPRQTLERYFGFWELVLEKAKPFLTGK